MRVAPRVVALVMSVAFGVAAHAAAQSSRQPAIHSVIVQPDTGVLTITGTGLGADLIVTVDGQSASVLPGATATRVEVQPPATVLTTPGTYRLTRCGPGAAGGRRVCRRQPATDGRLRQRRHQWDANGWLRGGLRLRRANGHRPGGSGGSERRRSDPRRRQ